MTYFRHGTTQLLTAVSVNIRLYGPDLVIFTAAFGLGEYDRSGPYNLILTSTEVNNCLILHAPILHACGIFSASHIILSHIVQ